MFTRFYLHLVSYLLPKLGEPHHPTLPILTYLFFFLKLLFPSFPL